MPINAHPDFIAAQKEFELAKGDEKKIETLEKMISLAPKHKGAENLRAQLKQRYKKLKEKIETEKKSKKASGKTSIKKEDLQTAIIGKTGTGKSSLLDKLTNAKPPISEFKFTTTKPLVGMMDYNGVPIQLIEIPAIESENYDKGVVNTADSILILITDLKQLEGIENVLEKTQGEKIVLFMKSDLFSVNEKRKISATLQSRKYNFVMISNKTGEGIEEMKEKLFQSFKKIRIYTKEPGKEKARRPIILNPESTIKNVAEKILKGFAKKIKETKIWGPSSKYPGQVVGLNHKMKDMDVVEFRTR